MRSDARAIAEEGKGTDGMAANLPPPGPTIDLGGDKEKEENEEDSFFKDQTIRATSMMMTMKKA